MAIGDKPADAELSNTNYDSNSVGFQDAIAGEVVALVVSPAAQLNGRRCRRQAYTHGQKVDSTLWGL